MADRRRPLALLVTALLTVAAPAAADPPAERPGATPPNGQDVADCRPLHGDHDPLATPEPTPEPSTVATATPEATAEPRGRGPAVRECLFGEGGPLHDLVGNVHAEAARQIVAAGIAQGYPDGTYRPNEPVNRGQMATFLARALDLAAHTGAAPADAAGSVHEDAIAAVAEAGIAQGHPDGTYRPNAPVTRGQMATFLARALDLAAHTGAAPADAAGSVHEDAIAAVAGAGIAQGYPDGTYRPNEPVTRGQMASFLVRALGL